MKGTSITSRNDPCPCGSGKKYNDNHHCLKFTWG